jgi:hypothetical protein
MRIDRSVPFFFPSLSFSLGSAWRRHSPSNCPSIRSRFVCTVESQPLAPAGGRGRSGGQTEAAVAGRLLQPHRPPPAMHALHFRNNKVGGRKNTSVSRMKAVMKAVKVLVGPYRIHKSRVYAHTHTHMYDVLMVDQVGASRADACGA